MSTVVRSPAVASILIPMMATSSRAARPRHAMEHPVPGSSDLNHRSSRTNVASPNRLGSFEHLPGRATEC